MKTLRKVLVVDDDPVVGKSFDRVLSGRGYAVVTASDGAEALRKIAAEEYDVVFTDIRMPGMDGIAVAEHIRDRQPWLPVVIVSGYATDENEARARAAGVATVLHKPLSPAMIEDSAREALRERRVHVPDAAVGPPVDAPRVAAEPRVGGADGSLLRQLALGFGAPTLGLLYVLVLPFAGLVTLLVVPFWFGGRALAKRAPGLSTWIRNVALFLAAPFVGLLYILALPFVGLGMLVWLGVRTALSRTDVA
jgi:CheY-like chemotaxis protein